MIVTITKGLAGGEQMRISHKRRWLLGAWAAALAVWVLVPFVKFAGSWQELGIGVVLAVAFGGGFASVARTGFRHAAARPPGYPGANRWLARVPAWVSAPVIVCLYMAIPAVIVFGTAWIFRRLPFMNVWGLCLCFIVACGAGGFWPLAWREQRKNRT
jgi:hypothetical protein